MMNMFLFRPALPTDDACCRMIAEAAYLPYLDRMDRKPAPMNANYKNHIKNDQVFVIEYSQTAQVIAFSVIVIKNKIYWLENIAVSPQYQKRGIGKMILFEVEQWLSQRTRSYQLYTNVVMHENIEWYKKQGFIQLRQALEDGFERLYFCKHLNKK